MNVSLGPRPENPVPDRPTFDIRPSTGASTNAYSMPTDATIVSPPPQQTWYQAENRALRRLARRTRSSGHSRKSSGSTLSVTSQMSGGRASSMEITSPPMASLPGSPLSTLPQLDHRRLTTVSQPKAEAKPTQSSASFRPGALKITRPSWRPTKSPQLHQSSLPANASYTFDDDAFQQSFGPLQTQPAYRDDNVENASI